MGAIYFDFGKKEDGYNLFRVSGSKEQVETAIQELVNLGCHIVETYELQKSFKEYSVLFKVFIPEENIEEETG